MKKFLPFLSLCLIFSTLFASARTVEEAAQAAMAIQSQHYSTKHYAPQAQPKLVYQATKVNSAENAYYVFNKANENGYIIVAADDHLPAVIGYTDSGSFDLENAPETFKSWLNNFTQNADYITSKAPKKVSNHVLPLLGNVKWNQGAPFNNDCPMDKSNRRSVTGCVATAIAQAMYLQQWPVKSENNPLTYTTRTGITVTNPFNHTYDWANMKADGGSTATEQKAVSQLIYDVGCALHMNYSSQSSGAFDKDMKPALENYFGYDTNMALLSRAAYTDTEWYHFIRYELDNGRAVIYNGQAIGGGHSFVCDGYDVNNYFHINWGWGGMSDGYYFLYNLSPSNQGTGSFEGGYNTSQVAMVGIQKPNPKARKYFGRLHIGDTEVPTAPFSKTATESVYFYDIANYGPNAFNGKLSFDVYRKDDMTFMKNLHEETNQFLAVNIGTLDMIEVPVNVSSLADGVYYLVPRSKDDNQSRYDYMISSGFDYHWLAITVAGNQVTIEKDVDDIIKIVGSDLKISGLNDKVCNGKTFVQFTLENQGQVLQSNFSLRLKTGTNSQELCSYFITMEPGTRAQFMPQVDMPARDGNHILELYIDTDNRKDHAFDSKFTKIAELPISVIPRNGDIPQLQVTEQIKLNDNNIGNKDNAALHIKLRNAGSETMCELFARVYRTGVETPLDYASTSVNLASGATQDITLDMTNCKLNNSDFTIKLEYFDPIRNNWHSVTPNNQASVTITWTVIDGLEVAEIQNLYFDGETLHNPNNVALSIYDMLGRQLLQGNENLSLSNLQTGVYIIQTPKGSFKVAK